MGALGRLRCVLLERDRELDLPADLLAGVDSAGSKVVLVKGEAGIGKSALVQELTRRVGDETHVLVGACDDLLTPQALGPFWISPARSLRSEDLWRTVTTWRP